jgi:lysophospholipase L1-like esterase
MNLLRPLAAAAVALAVVVSPAQAVAKPTATIVVPTTTPVEGTSIVVTGTVTNVPTGTHVTFQRDIGRGWVAVKALSVDKAHHYSVSYTAVLGPNKLRVILPKSGSRPAANSPVVTLTGPVGVTPKAPKPTDQIRVEGRLPTPVVRTVVLQTSETSGWVTRATGKSASSGSLALSAALPISETIRVVAPQVVSQGKQVYPEFDSPSQRVDVTPLPLTLAPTPTVTGDALFGTTLTAVSGGWDPGVVLAWQWLRGGVVITGATQATYALGVADLDQTLAVRVTGSKSGYATTTKTSAPTASVRRAALASSPTPTIDGVLSPDEQVKAVPGTWDPGTTLSYAWLLNGTVISGQTSATYTVRAGDVGSRLTTTVTGTRPGYTTAARTSAQTAVITVGALKLTPQPTITGAAVVGSQLVAATGDWDAGATLARQWLREGSPIAGATSNAYVVTNADAGARLSVRIQGTKPGHLSASRTSDQTAAVTGGSLTATPTPTIAGTPGLGQTLSVATGAWDAGTTLSIQWRRGGTAIAGATGGTYVIKEADVGAALTVTVTGSKTGFTTVQRTSTPTGVVPPGALSTAAPTIGGTPQMGQVLTADPRVWGPAPVALAYQWLRDGTAIASATTSSYAMVPADVGTHLSVRVTGTKDHYAAATRTSDATAGVTLGTQVLTPTPTISGEPSVGGQLEVVPGSWATGATLAYQWLRGGAAISGATSATYVITAVDAGTQLSVRVTGSQAGYAPVSRTSDLTAMVTGLTLTSAPTPTVIGTAALGETLLVATGSWDSGVVLTYQWQRNGSGISGETGASHAVTAADVGARLAVRVTGTKPGFAPVARTSALTSVVLPGDLQTSVPVVVGDPQPLAVLAAEPGQWGPAHVDFTFQWVRDGVVIDGATKAAYTLVDQDAGSLLQVSVTGSEPGYTSKVTTSERVSVPGPQSVSKVARALRTFHAALQNADHEPVDIFAGPSDSLADGARASSVEKRWTNAVTNDLRAKYEPAGVAGGLGYSDPVNYGEFPDYPISYVRGIGNFTIGLGRQGLALFDATTQSITVDDTYSDLDILYTGVSDGSFGWFSYSVDGGAPVIVHTGDKTVSRGGYVAKVSGLGLGHHVVVIRQSPGHGGVMIEGVMLYSGDRNSGVRMWEGGHSGLTAADYVAPNGGWAESLAEVHPDLVVLPIGSNDFALGTSAAVTRGRIEEIISIIRSHVDTKPSIVLMPYYERPTAGTETWDAYVNMYKSIAAADPDVCVFDLGPLFGPYKGDTRGGLMAPDLLHPSDAGYALIGKSLADFLTAP